MSIKNGVYKFADTQIPTNYYTPAEIPLFWGSTIKQPTSSLFYLDQIKNLLIFTPSSQNGVCTIILTITSSNTDNIERFCELSAIIRDGFGVLISKKKILNVIIPVGKQKKSQLVTIPKDCVDTQNGVTLALNFINSPQVRTLVKIQDMSICLLTI